MTITMNLEIEEGISFSDISRVLLLVDAECDFENGYLVGNFKKSNAYFVFNLFGEPESIVAEGVDDNWMVGMTGAFQCAIEYLSECSADIIRFVEKLSKNTDYKFVLSFQYESLYVIRNDVGISFLKNMVD